MYTKYTQKVTGNYNPQTNTVDEFNVGQLGLAYEFNTLHYSLAYLAFNLLEEYLEKHPAGVEEIAERFGVPVETVWEVTEELYTDNGDPDPAE
jgi:hypothetical protein